MAPVRRWIPSVDSHPPPPDALRGNIPGNMPIRISSYVRITSYVRPLLYSAPSNLGPSTDPLRWSVTLSLIVSEDPTIAGHI